MDFSIGLVEVSALGNAIKCLDDMLKVADVEFVATERKLGGRLVTVVVKGELTAVSASVDAGAATAKANDCLKASQVIARPHEEILKFLHLDGEEKEPNSEFAGTHVGVLPERKASGGAVKTAAKPAAKTAARTAKTASAKKPAAKKPAVKKTETAAAEPTAPKRRGRQKKSEN